MLEFGPTNSNITQCFSLQVQDDNVALEETDVLTLTLSIPADRPGAILGPFSMATVMAMDDDGRWK